MKSGKANRRRMLAGMLALSILCTGSLIGTDLPASAADSALTGDVNLDGAVNAQDVTALQQYLVRKATLSAQAAQNADLTGDGILNGVDLALLKRQVLNEVPQAETTYIHLKDSYIEVEGNHATLSNSNKTVTIDASGTYYIDGTLTDGQIVVNVPDVLTDPETVKLFLNGVNITGSTAAPILIENAENTSLNLVAGSTNYVYDGEAYTANTAAIFAKDDMTIKGEGALVVTASTQYGIHCNNDLKITGGDITVITENAVTKMDGIRAQQSVIIKDGTVQVNATGDGIKSTQADVAISGGSVSIKAGNDAIQAETTLDISAGTVLACGDRGLTSLVATNITGGSVCATATDYQASLVRATQGCMLLTYAAEWTNGNEISVQSGNTAVFAATPIKKFDYVLMSSPDMTDSAAYSLYTGGVQMKHSNDATGVFQMTSNASFVGVEPIDGSGTVTTEAGIQLNGSYLTASGEGVEQTSSTIATITQPGTYNVTGSMTGGQIVVNVDKTLYPDGLVELVLNGIELTNTADSPIYVASIGDECRINAADGTTSTISDGTSYTNADGGVGAIYACDDLKLKGKGTLIVNGNCEDGIVCKNDLKIWNGTVSVTAADDGIRGKDSVRIGDPMDTDFSALNVTIQTKGGDGIKSTEEIDATKGFVCVNGGTVTINSYGDAISGVYSVEINGGSLDLATTGSRTSGSAKGLKAGYTDDTTNTEYTGNVVVNGGYIKAATNDDCINANGDVSILGGQLELQTNYNSSGYQGIHADNSCYLGKDGGAYSDFALVVYSAYEGIEAYNIYQKSGSTIVNTLDDAFNVAGGADNSGSSGMWPGQGGGMGGSSAGVLEISGGFSLVNVQDGDHDGYDSNGSITISGGICVSNGQEPFDSDSGISYTGGVYVKDTGSGGMGGPGGGMGGPGGGMGGGSSMTESVSVSASVTAGTRITLCDGSGNVIVSFFADKAVTSLVAGCTAYSGAAFYTGGELNGSTYFQELDDTQLAAYGGTISGGTAVSQSGGGSTNPWG